MNTGLISEADREAIEKQKEWLRESARAVYSEPDAIDVHQYLNQLWETGQTDMQQKMLIRCCCENLEKQFPGKFNFAFLGAVKQSPADNSGFKQSGDPEIASHEVSPDMRPKIEIQCTACGFVLNAGANFCPKCGENLSIAQNDFSVCCAKCNSQLKKSEIYCSRCGELVNYRPAGMIKRGCAIFLDLIALGFFMPVCMYAVAWLTFLLAMSGLNAFPLGNGRFIHPILFAVGMFFFLSGLYYLLMEKGLKLGSLGKKLLGLRLISSGKQPMTIKNTFLRHVGRFLEVLVLSAGPLFVGMWSWGAYGSHILYPHEMGFILTAVDIIFLVIIVSRLIREKRFFHDSISDTIVIEA